MRRLRKVTPACCRRLWIDELQRTVRALRSRMMHLPRKQRRARQWKHPAATQVALASRKATRGAGPSVGATLHVISLRPHSSAVCPPWPSQSRVPDVVVHPDRFSYRPLASDSDERTFVITRWSHRSLQKGRSPLAGQPAVPALVVQACPPRMASAWSSMWRTPGTIV
jgi:hypothetical protein